MWPFPSVEVNVLKSGCSLPVDFAQDERQHGTFFFCRSFFARGGKKTYSNPKLVVNARQRKRGFGGAAPEKNPFPLHKSERIAIDVACKLQD